MCKGERLVADFVAGTRGRPEVPAVLAEHLTTTVVGTWVVWAHKLARQQGNLFVPLTGGPGYPADARAQCWKARGNHDAPDPLCTCGFHALSNPTLPGLQVTRDVTALTVVLSGRVLAFEWSGGGVLWRAGRQTVVRPATPTPPGGTASVPGTRLHPGERSGPLAVVSAVTPLDSALVRLHLAVSAPVLPVCHDDAGFCRVSSTLEHSYARLAAAMAQSARPHPAGNQRAMRPESSVA